MTLAALIPDAASAARRNATWLDPKLLGGAIQVSRAVGWRKLVPLLAVGILAAGVGMELFGREGRERRAEWRPRACPSRVIPKASLGR